LQEKIKEIPQDKIQTPDELPFMIKVSGFKFTPIHQFRPEIQPNPGIGIGKRFITENIPFKQDWQSQLTNN
jgi:hypothetical protein